MLLQSFEFSTTHRIINEIGGSKLIHEYCHQLNITKLLIVTDKGIVEHGILNALTNSLTKANIGFSIFDNVIADPPEHIVESAAKTAINNTIDGVIGIGGGSSMDCAKLVSVLVLKQQTLNSMYGIDNIASQRCPLILIPTTAGTGSEVTPISIVTTGETTKMGVVSPVLLPDIALLDASLTLGLPAPISAATGIDAMVHAIEAYTSKIKKNPYSDMLAKEALRLLSANIEAVCKDGKDIVARQNMLLGSCLAGQAFANAPVAAVHALAYPLGGHFHISHGLSNALVLPHVLRFNQQEACHLYTELIPYILPEKLVLKAPLNASDVLADYFTHLSKDLGLPSTLRECGINKDVLPTLAEDAMLQTRLLMNNPRTLTYQDALTIYEHAY
jgi:alcohol dehydrogenase